MPEAKQMIGFRATRTKRIRLDRMLLSRERQGLELQNKTELFEYLLDGVLDGTIKLPKAKRAAANTK